LLSALLRWYLEAPFELLAEESPEERIFK